MLDRWIGIRVDDGPERRYPISECPAFYLSVAEAQLRAGTTICSGDQDAIPEQLLERIAIERVIRSRQVVT